MHHSPLAVSPVQQARRAAAREQRRSTTGAVAAVRQAAAHLSLNGATTMTSRQLVDAALKLGAGFTPETLREAVQIEVTDEGGHLVRLRRGVLMRRDFEGGDPPPVLAGARSTDQVLAVLRELRDEGRVDVSRVEVAERLEHHGVRYSARTVRDVLTRLLRDPQVPVARTGHHYRLTL